MNIRFETNGYRNLRKLFAICDNKAECQFYLNAAETLGKWDKITPNELHTLRRIGRQLLKTL